MPTIAVMILPAHNMSIGYCNVPVCGSFLFGVVVGFGFVLFGFAGVGVGFVVTLLSDTFVLVKITVLSTISDVN